MTSLFVFGLGYSARAVVRRMRPALDQVWGTTRDAAKLDEIAALGATGLRFDGAATADPSPRGGGELAAATHILVSIAPDQTGDPVLRHFGKSLAAGRPKSLVYLSTVGVYGDHGGAWVDETSACRPVSERALRRLDAEAAWQSFASETGVPVAIVRLAGITGPDADHSRSSGAEPPGAS